MRDRRAKWIVVLLLLAVPTVIVTELARERGRVVLETARTEQLAASEPEIRQASEDTLVRRTLAHADLFRSIEGLVGDERSGLGQTELELFLLERALAHDSDGKLVGLSMTELAFRAIDVPQDLIPKGVMWVALPRTVRRKGEEERARRLLRTMQLGLPLVLEWRSRFEAEGKAGGS